MEAVCHLSPQSWPTILQCQGGPFPRQLIIWSPSKVILNSDTFHLRLKNNFHSSPSLPFKILLSNLHGLLNSLYSIYCYLVLPFFLKLTSLPLWLKEFPLRWILSPFGVCHDLLAICLALVFEKGSSYVDQADR